jgi:integrase/recombinase XerD
MVAHFYSDYRAHWIRRLYVGPLARYLDGFATFLLENGYSRLAGQRHLFRAAALSDWLEGRHLRLSDLDVKRIKQFFLRRTSSAAIQIEEATTVRVFLEYLRSTGVSVPQLRQEQAISPLERAYAEHLERERGVCRNTRSSHMRVVRQFVQEHLGRKRARPSQLRARDVTEFVLHHARERSHSKSVGMTIALRSFFAFLRQRGDITADLAACVPRVACWRLTTIPRYLDQDKVEKVLKSPDRRTCRGKRDYAILLFLARLGLRAGEVVAMTLDDINWAAGEIMVRGKASKQDRLPLFRDVGRALSSYLRIRPPCSTRRVFLCERAPHRGFGGPASICDVVGRAFTRAGLHIQGKAHVLRHSLATQMLSRGANLSEIGEILRHQHVDSTAIYAKVDFDGLRTVLQPWPGGSR